MVRENREIRGWMLNIIDRAKPYGASFEVIEVTLTDLGFNVCETGVKAQLKYLSDKGYVKYEPIERSGIVRHLIGRNGPREDDPFSQPQLTGDALQAISVGAITHHE